MKDEVELVRWRGGRSWEECSDQRVVTSKTLGWEGEGRLWDAELQVRKELSDGKGEWMLLHEWKLIMIFTLFSISMIFSLHQKKRKKKVKTHSPKFNCYLIPTRPLVSQYYWSQCPNISEKFRHFPLPGVWCCAYSFSCVQLFVVLWTVACQAPLSMGILQARILE